MDFSTRIVGTSMRDVLAVRGALLRALAFEKIPGGFSAAHRTRLCSVHTLGAFTSFLTVAGPADREFLAAGLRYAYRALFKYLGARASYAGWLQPAAFAFSPAPRESSSSSLPRFVRLLSRNRLLR